MPGGIITFIIVIMVTFVLFKLFNWSIKIFFKLLINALIGIVILLIFNFIFAGILSLGMFAIPITWVTALVTGILGVPGVILLLIIQLL